MTQKNKPQNILFLWTDQQRADSIAACRPPGTPGPNTPHLDRLATSGAIFDRAYVAQPVCSPARASVVTGLFPHTHGVTHNSMTLPADATTIAELLRPHGYACGYSGKWHLGREHCAQRGFDDFWSSTEDYKGGYAPGEEALRDGPSDYLRWLIRHGHIPPHTTAFSRRDATRMPEAACKPAFQAEECIRFLETYQHQPFLLMCNFLEPHPPNFGPYDGMYDPAGDPSGGRVIPLPDSWYRQFEPSVPLRFRVRQQSTAHHTGPQAGSPDDKWRPSQLETLDERGWQQVIARYWGLVTLIDTFTGRILTRLEELGLADNTIVVFNTDHGDMMGEHQLLNKSIPYEGAAHIPLLIRVPGLPPRRIATPASHVDLVPTLLDLLDLPSPARERLQGKSLAPLLRDGDPPATAPNAPDEVDLIFEWNGYDGYPRDFTQPARLSQSDDEERRLRAVDSRTIRRGHWKLTLHASGEHELYDLHADPGETHNAYPDPTARPIIESLSARLRAWQRRTADPLTLPPI